MLGQNVRKHVQCQKRLRTSRKYLQSENLNSVTYNDLRTVNCLSDVCLQKRRFGLSLNSIASIVLCLQALRCGCKLSASKQPTSYTTVAIVDISLLHGVIIAKFE